MVRGSWEAHEARRVATPPRVRLPPRVRIGKLHLDAQLPKGPCTNVASSRFLHPYFGVHLYTRNLHGAFWS